MVSISNPPYLCNLAPDSVFVFPKVKIIEEKRIQSIDIRKNVTTE